MNIRTKKRNAPRFALSSWNKYREVMAEQATTTNTAKGFNSVIVISLPRNTNVWQVCKQFIQEEGLVRTKMRDSARSLDDNAGRARNIKLAARRSEQKAILKNLKTPHTLYASYIDYFQNLQDFYNDD